MKKLTLFIFLLPLSIQALLVEPMGGAKGLGRANAQIAEPRDAMVGASNPAAMAFLGDRWDIGGTLLHQYGTTEVYDNLFINGEFDNSITDYYGFPDIAVNKGICDCDFTLGFLAYTRTFIKSDYDTNFPFFGTTDISCEYLHETFSPVCSIRLGSNHAFGMSVDVHVQRFRVNGLENWAIDEFTTQTDKVTNNKYNNSIGVGVTLGWMSRVSDCVSIAVAWQPPTYARCFGKYEGLLAEQGWWNIPQRILGGVSVKALPCLSFEFDIEYIEWNHIPALDHPLFVPGTNGDESLLGQDNGPGFGWRDQMIFRLGAEWKFHKKGAIRIGYQHARHPMDTDGTLLGILMPETPEDLITVGGTYRFDYFNELSFFYGHAFTHLVPGVDSIPAGILPFGFGGGEANITRQKDFFGLSWGRYY